MFLENKAGRVNEVARLLGEAGVNMTAFCIAENQDFGIMRVIVSDVDLAVRVLKENKFAVTLTDVICIECPNVPGGMSKVLERLAAEGVFIEYMYAFSRGDVANVVIRPTDTCKCCEIMGSDEG